MGYKGVIFDLDGVLCSTDRLHYLAWKVVADKVGVRFDEEMNNRLRGISRMASLDIILGESGRTFTAEEKAAIADEKNTIYRGLISEMSEADCPHGVKEVLRTLRDGGIRLAIGSSSKNAPQILDALKLRCYFDAVSDGNNITRSKPNPEVFTKAAEMLSLPPVDCLVVEDSLAGIEAGILGGFDTAAVGEAALSDKALYRLASLTELPEIIYDN